MNQNRNTEAFLHAQAADYLRLKYPDVIFHSDYGSGVKLTMSQAVTQKRLNGGRRAWPDLFIAEPKEEYYDRFYETNVYSHGLFIELKRDGTRLKKRNGEWATKHIAEQAAVLEALRDRGYVAEFAVGFKEARLLIEKYLKHHRSGISP